MMVAAAYSSLRHLFRRRAEMSKPLPISHWPNRLYGALRLNGQWVFTQGWFRRHVAGGLRADNARKGNPAVVANVVSDLRAWLFFAHRFEAQLRFTDRSMRLTGGGFLDFPWTMAPRPHRLAVHTSDGQIGTLELTGSEIIGRDLAGQTVARWQTVHRLGSMLPGTDEPVYAPLSINGRQIAELRVPRWRTQSRHWLDFEGVSFVRDLDLSDDPSAETWLLAYLALSAQASLNLMARSQRWSRS
jgi:hypothetical protein